MIQQVTSSDSVIPIGKSPGKILTFYSYKGGTGRSMALANVAWMLALNNKRVLVIDWDLEAPGVHRYFHPFLEDKELRSSRGLIDLVEDLAARQATSPEPLADEEGDISSLVLSLDHEGWDWERFGDRAGIDLLPAGQQSAGYSTKVNSFNWISFYERLGGRRFLAYMSAQVKKVYDYILIDSRTGVSDTSGICTVEMPDALVVCFTLNEQSIRGAANVCESVVNQRAGRREKLGTEDNSAAPSADPFRIYPVPTRIEQSEYKKKQVALSLVQKTFSRYLVDYSPGEQSKYWGGSQMAYVPVYAFEEIPAIFGDSPDDQLSICAFIGRLTSTVTQESGLSLEALPEEVRLRAFEWFQRPSEAKEDAAQMAEAAYQQLPQNLQRKSRQVLARLVQFDSRGGRTSQVVSREDLERGLAEATDALIKANVLKSVATQTGQALQLSDPLILENWTAYRDWVEKDQVFLQWRQAINTAARSWRLTSQRESHLLRDDSLEEAKNHLRVRAEELNYDEEQFISTSAERDKTRRKLEELSRSNSEALEKQVTQLAQQLASKQDVPPKVRWYRSPIFIFASSAAVAVVFLSVYWPKFRNEQAYRQVQSEEARLLADQNQALTAKLNDSQAEISKLVYLAETGSRKQSDPKAISSGKETSSSKPKSGATEPPTIQSSIGGANQMNSLPASGLSASPLICRVIPATWSWTTTGRLLVQVDSKTVGGINVGQDQSGFDFACSPGSHTYQVYGETMAVKCQGEIMVQAGATYLFLAFAQTSPGPPSCRLTSVAGGAHK